MSYPKPLSQKTLDRMYKESGLSDEKIEFLRKLFDGAAALYGIISLKELWEVYREYAGKVATLRIHRKDITAFSSIARREIHDYYVYEIDELYKEEPRILEERIIVYREIMDIVNKQVFYVVENETYNKPFYVPENLLELKGHVVSEEEKELIHFIENLRADSPVLVDRWKKNLSRPSPHQGKKLKDIHCLTYYDQLFLNSITSGSENGLSKYQERQLKEFWDRKSGTTAENIFAFLRICVFTGWLPLTRLIPMVIDDLEDVGVNLNDKESEKLLSLITKFNNRSHLYTNRGWTPDELGKSSMKDYKGPINISFGPGIQQSIKEGNFSLDELMAKMKEMGFNVE